MIKTLSDLMRKFGDVTIESMIGESRGHESVVMVTFRGRVDCPLCDRGQRDGVLCLECEGTGLGVELGVSG